MNKGFKNEMDIARATHGKAISELNPFWKKNIAMMFPEAKQDEIVRCHQLRGTCKTDLEFSVGFRTANMSVKQGRSNTVHGESVWSFVRFLRGLGVSKQTIAVFLYYQFGDGTLKGDGKERYTVDDMRVAHEEAFDAANEEFQQRHVIGNMIMRTIVHGVSPNYKDIDWFYYGTAESGYLASVEDVMLFLLDKKVSRVSTLSFGPLSYQPYSRNLERDPRDESKRFIVQIKWPQMADDMKVICSAAKYGLFPEKAK